MLDRLFIEPRRRILNIINECPLRSRQENCRQPVCKLAYEGKTAFIPGENFSRSPPRQLRGMEAQRSASAQMNSAPAQDGRPCSPVLSVKNRANSLRGRSRRLYLHIGGRAKAICPFSTEIAGCLSQTIMALRFTMSVVSMVIEVFFGTAFR